MNMEDILERYSSYRGEIQEYMKYFIKSLADKQGEVNETFILSLDLLALNLDVMFKAVDEMKDKGMTETDKYRGEKKSGAMQAFFNSQNFIHKILANFGMQPMAKSKMKDTHDKLDAEKFLKTLIK